MGVWEGVAAGATVVVVRMATGAVAMVEASEMEGEEVAMAAGMEAAAVMEGSTATAVAMMEVVEVGEV